MFLTIVCQPEYSGTFEVMSVAEYHQPFIQKKLKKTFVYKSIVDKKKPLIVFTLANILIHSCFL